MGTQNSKLEMTPTVWNFQSSAHPALYGMDEWTTQWTGGVTVADGSASGSGSVGLPRFGGHREADAVVEFVEAVGKGEGAPFSTTPQTGGRSPKGEGHASDTSTIPSRVSESDR